MTAEPTGIAAFVAEAVYHSRLWLFIEGSLPAVTIGVFTVFIGRSESREILRNVPRQDRSPKPNNGVVRELAIVGGFFGGWLAISFAFVAIGVVGNDSRKASPPPCRNATA